jgi:integrase
MGSRRGEVFSLNRLSDRTVRTVGAGLYCDGGGLYLQVTPGREAGRFNRSWLFRYATGEVKTSESGKPRKVERQMGLGSYPDVTLADARQKATDARRLRKQGLDPIAHRDAQKATATATAVKAMTFDQCRDGYVADHEKGWSAGHRQDWLAIVTNHASLVFGALPVAAVDTPLVLRALRPIWTTKHVTARRLRGFVESVLDWATVHHYRKAEPNPARWKGHLSEILPRTDDVHLVEHHPALPYVELPELVAGLTACSDPDAHCLLLLILTATRVSAATGASAEEFDLANCIWTIPASRMKRRGKRKALPFRVPLSDAAIAIVARAGVKEGPLFPGVDNKSLAKAHGRGDITTHGFRATFKTWAEEKTDHANEIIEMALAHAVGDETEEAYRRGDARERRAKLMADWARFCTTSTPADNIVPFSKSA